jgi:hypothetical protein
LTHDSHKTKRERVSIAVPLATAGIVISMLTLIYSRIDKANEEREKLQRNRPLVSVSEVDQIERDIFSMGDDTHLRADVFDQTEAIFTLVNNGNEVAKDVRLQMEPISPAVPIGDLAPAQGTKVKAYRRYELARFRRQPFKLEGSVTYQDGLDPITQIPRCVLKIPRTL